MVGDKGEGKTVVRKAGRAAKSARGEQTRERVRDAANRLFLAKGFKGTTVDAVCEAAGVSKGTFYLHFDRKEDLLLEYGLRRLRRVQEMLPQLITGKTFREAMDLILDETVRGKPWDRAVTGLAIREMGTSYEGLPVESPYTLFVPLIEIAQARGEVRADIPAPAVARFVVRSILGALRDWGLGDDESSRDEALDYAVTLIFEGLRASAPTIL